jgi:hypothetical protein
MRHVAPAVATLTLVVAVLAVLPERIPAWCVTGAVLLGALVAMIVVYLNVRLRGRASS